MTGGRDRSKGTSASRRLAGAELDRQRHLLQRAKAYGAGITLVALIEPWPLRFLIDEVILNEEAQALSGPATLSNSAGILSLVAGIVLLLAATRSLFESRQGILVATAGENVSTELRQKLFRRVLSLSPISTPSVPKGDLLIRLTGDVALLREALTRAPVVMWSQLLQMASMLVVLLILNWRLSLIALGVALLLVPVRVEASRRLQRVARARRRHLGALSTFFMRALQATSLIKAAGAGQEVSERARALAGDGRGLGVHVARVEQAVSRRSEIVMAGGVGLMLALGTAEVLNGRLSAGLLLVCLAYLRASYKPARRLAKLSMRLAKAESSAQRIESILEPLRTRRVSFGNHPDTLAGEIRLRKVGTTYPGSPEPVLVECTTTIPAGSLTAVAGPSGAGKSTLLSLLAGFHEPTTGSIWLGGWPLQSIPLNRLRSQVAWSAPDLILNGFSVAENLTLGNMTLSDQQRLDRAQDLAKRFGADAFIGEIPNGYRALLGPEGTELSAGERQRIALARAFGQEAPILLLDEPSSFLDASLVRLFSKRLLERPPHQTVVMVTHSPDLLGLTDQVLFLRRTNRPPVVGSHSDLIRSCRAYRDYVEGSTAVSVRS